jgi:NAD(P)-dependent dehydrogenase (short-subunit alcohol dehydrogenase family)
VSEQLTGKVAIVTGAAGGMGQAIVRALAGEGAAVVASDIDELRGSRLVSELENEGAVCDFVVTDVSDAVSVERLIAEVVDVHGGLDIAVNAAAVEFESGPISDTSDEDFDRMIAVNLRSVFLCMKHEIRAMKKTGRGGAIVNIGSTNSFRPQPNQPAYTASKHGVLGLTRSAALDHARDGIRVNAIAPGAINTPMLESAMERWNLDSARVQRRLSLLGRFGEPEEVAAAAVWLCSDSSSFTTGHALAVDGGFLAY